MKARFLSQVLGLCALLSLGAVLQAQTTLGIQDFENPNVASPVWGFTNTGGGFITGSSAAADRPASSPFQVSGIRAFQANNTTATLNFAPINTGSYTNIRFTARLASFSVGGANGADGTDIVRVEISTNGGATYTNNLLRVEGNNNACWSYAGGLATATTAYPTTATFQPASGGLISADGYSTLEITNLPAVADLRLRIVMTNNSANERWIIDDVKLEGDPISCTAPTTQASATTAPTASVTATSIDLNWTSGNGLRRLVVARQGSAVTATPVNGSTYTAGAFGTGSDLGSGQFVVYEGTGSSASLSGLIPGTVYHFAVFEYNCAGASSVYNTSLGAGNRAQAQTLPANVALTPGCLSASSFDLSWTLPAGDYDGIVIFARENLAPANPIDDETVYIGANSDFSAAPVYGARGSLVYKGTGTNVTITGLTPGASYIFRAYTYKNSVASVWSTGTQTGQTIGLANVTAAGAVGTGLQTLDLGWVNPTAGCWDEILVVVNDASGISFVPTGDGSAYSANPTYSGNNQVVYQGTGNAVSLDGLTAGTLYYFEIFVRRGNSWSSGIEVVGTPSQILRSGDLMIIGFDNNTGGGVDFFSIVTLVDLYPGTQFILANACYELFAAANTRTDRWYACDGNGTKALAAQLFTYMGTTPLTAGSVICMNLPTTSAPATNLSINGTATTDISVSQIPGIAMNVNFSTGDPDAIFLMQGTFTEQIDHYTFAGRILSGIQDGATWYAFSDNLTTLGTGAPRRRSRIPADIECFAIQGSTSSVTYRTRYTGTVIGSQAELIGLIVNYASNWTTGANYNCSQPFTVSGTYAANIWTGAADENWFNCANWLNRVVPDETTDVAIGMNPVPTPARDAHINPAAPFADRYNFVAKTRNLSINIRQVQLQNAAELQVHGSLVLSAAGSLDLSTSASNALYLHGDWDNQISSAAFSEGGEVHLVGTQDQIIATNDPAGEEMFETLIINKTSGRVQNFCDYLMITEAMRFDQGIVDNIGGAFVYFEPNAQALNASDLSHVNGAVLKNTAGIGGGYFVYPTGKGGHYGAIGLMAQTGLGEIYQAEYFHNGYGTYNLDPTCLDHVSLLEYWNVEEFFGGTGEQVQLTLHWTPYSRVFDPADLRIAHYFPVGANPLQWNCEPHINISGVSASGTITSDWLSQFSPFTFGTPVDDTSLPLELLSFEAQRQGQAAQISWILAKEEAGVRYFVERSPEPTQGFETLAELQGQGRLSYAQLDNSPLNGWNYYRLRQIEADGSVDYSPIRALFFEGKASGLEVFPNPSQGQAFVRGLEGEVEVEVLNTLGQRLSRFQIQTQAGQATSLPLDELPAGSYYLRFLSAQGQAQTLWIKR